MPKLNDRASCDTSRCVFVAICLFLHVGQFCMTRIVMIPYCKCLWDYPYSRSSLMGSHVGGLEPPVIRSPCGVCFKSRDRLLSRDC